jgi:uncharacterized membrane protein YphA (DoxX/SURF4 family)
MGNRVYQEKTKSMRRILIEIICFLLVLLFVYAAVSKLNDYEIFKVQLSKSPFITDYASIIAWALPIGEILIGMALTFKKTRLLGLYSSLFLMTMFTAYIYIMLHYSYYIPCSCGGILSAMSWKTHLWFNVGFVLLSILGIFAQTKQNYLFSKQSTKKIVELPPVVYTAMS